MEKNNKTNMEKRGSLGGRVMTEQEIDEILKDSKNRSDESKIRFEKAAKAVKQILL